MPRAPRKSASESIILDDKPKKMSILNATIVWFKLKIHIILFGLLVSILSVTSTLVVQNYLMPKKSESPTLANVDTSMTSNKLTLLEQELEKQILISKKLETTNDTLLNNLKAAEKRIQFHNELLKRMCEYIVLITVDKKIIPRQCVSDYNWRKEENGN